MLVRRTAREPLRPALDRARDHARRPGRDGARAGARARRGGHRPGDRLHEPPRDAPAPGRGDRPRDAHRQPAVVSADRPRRLQARQRPPRPLRPATRCCARSCQSLVGEFRAFDRVARYGGDEFVVILPNADLESAATAAATARCARLRTLPSGEVDARRLRVDRRRASGSAPMSTDAACCEPATPPCCAPSARARAASRAPSSTGAERPLPERRAPLTGCHDVCETAGAGLIQEAHAREQLWRAATLAVAGREYEIFRLDALQERFDVARLPFSLKVLLENLLRTEGNGSVTRGGHRGARRAGTPKRAAQHGRSPSRPRAC